MCKHYIWSEGNWWDLGKEALSLANFPQTQPTITTAPALCKQHIVRKEEKVFKKTFMTWFTLQSILTFFKNGPLYQQLWNSSFVTICRMRLVRSLLSLLLGFSTVSSRILEDGDLIVDNSILEVEMPRFYIWPSSRPRGSIFCNFVCLFHMKTLGGGEDGPGCVQSDCEQQLWSAIQHS